MLRLEDELRLSAGTQAAFKAYRMAGLSEVGMSAVVAAVQHRVCLEFGVSDAVGIEALQCAEALIPGDPEVIQLSLYRRHNRCTDGALTVGDAAPNVHLYPVSLAAKAVARTVVCDDFENVSSHSMVSSGRPLVLIAGSYT